MGLAKDPVAKAEIDCVGGMKMKNKPITQTQKKVEYAWMNSPSGMATALLVTILSIFVIFVTAGVYAFKNRQIWIAYGITAAMNAVINNSGIASQQKSQV